MEPAPRGGLRTQKRHQQRRRRRDPAKVRGTSGRRGRAGPARALLGRQEMTDGGARGRGPAGPSGAKRGQAGRRAAGRKGQGAAPAAGRARAFSLCSGGGRSEAEGPDLGL
jgi:hypothetical protein